jgi:glycine C-acetyltransferase
MAELEQRLREVPDHIRRVIVVFDGVFSMRGDCAPVDRIVSLTQSFHHRFPEGVITVMDDSHGIGAFGRTGRGTMEVTGAAPDVIIGTFGKAFGVNGGFVAASPAVVEAIRQKADTYIYTNPLSVADCAAALAAIDLCDGPEGRRRLEELGARTQQFRDGIAQLGLESIPGQHPVVPLMVRDTPKTKEMVQDLFERGVLVVGLTHPVVPWGDESIRFQINAAHTRQDVDGVMDVLSQYKR